MKRLGNIKSKIPLLLRVVSLYVVAGFGLWYAYTNIVPKPVHIAQTQATVHVAPPTPSNVLKTGKPVTILVPGVGMDLSIIDGEYDTAHDSWTLTDDKAQFATMTDQPNDRAGNTFIYGHNTDAVFAKLAGLKAGDTAIIKTSNGLSFSYVYTGEQIVQPTNTQILNDEPLTPRLTLMTCEGIFSQTRRVMYFDFKGVA